MATQVLDAQRVATIKRSYSTRRVPISALATLVNDPAVTPRAGDLLLARVLSTGHHTSLELTGGRRSFLFPGDEILVCYGNRYAPDQFEAEMPTDLGECHLVAAGGIASRVLSSHTSTRPPTQILPLGLVGDAAGQALNLRSFAIAKAQRRRDVPVIAVVGTSMNSGKTTSAAHLVHGLSRAGYRVGAAKVTGTGAGGDIWKMKDSGAAKVLDFTDAGMPTTYLLPEADVHMVFDTLIGDLVDSEAEVIVIEVADGLNQRETAMLLSSDRFRGAVSGLLFAASDALGAAAGAAWLIDRGLPLLAITGRMTQSPLAVRECADTVGLPVFSPAELAMPDTASVRVLYAADGNASPPAAIAAANATKIAAEPIRIAG